MLKRRTKPPTAGMWKAKNCICFDMANVIFNTTNARLVEIEFSFGN